MHTAVPHRSLAGTAFTVALLAGNLTVWCFVVSAALLDAVGT
jgi:hypothetical protein